MITRAQCILGYWLPGLLGGFMIGFGVAMAVFR